MKRSGFTLLEIIIVVAILSILAGVAVPYYSDYITETRASALKSNLANIRKVLEEFRGDHGRGPYIKTVIMDTDSFPCGFPQADINELVAGVVPTWKAYKDGVKQKRTNIKYLNSFPVVEDQFGAAGTFTVATSSRYFKDGTGAGAVDNKFDLGREFYFDDLNGSGEFEGAYDQIGSGTFADGETGLAADVTAITYTDSQGNQY